MSVTVEAEGRWNAKIPAHLIVSLDWARFSNGTIVWSWRCLCGVKGSTQNDYLGSTLWAHITEKS